MAAASGEDLATVSDIVTDSMTAFGLSASGEFAEGISNASHYADISETTDGLSKVQQIQAASTIFGKESMAGLLSIVNASDEDFAKLTTSICKCNGAAEKMAKIKLDNLKGDLTLLSSAAEGAKIALGKELAPAARAAVQGVTEIVNAFNSGGLEVYHMTRNAMGVWIRI